MAPIGCASLGQTAKSSSLTLGKSDRPPRNPPAPLKVVLAMRYGQKPRLHLIPEERSQTKQKLARDRMARKAC
jgi:hypothetical protein